MSWDWTHSCVYRFSYICPYFKARRHAVQNLIFCNRGTSINFGELILNFTCYTCYTYCWRFPSNPNWLPLSGASLNLNDAAHNYLVQRYGVFDHAPQAVDDGRESDSARCITFAVHLGPSPREIEHGTALQRNVILKLLQTTFSWNYRCSLRRQTSAPKSDGKTRNVNLKRCEMWKVLRCQGSFNTKTQFPKFSRYGSSNLVCPRFKRESEGGRSFSVRAARIWIALPNSSKKSTNVHSFKKGLIDFYASSLKDTHRFIVS